MARLREAYNKTIKQELVKKFAYSNVHQVPKIEKIVVNCVTRDAVTNGKMVESIASDLATITGQKPIVVKAKKSIASFKLREGQAMGAAVTLRGNTMYEFLDRLVSLTLPRVRDFKGINPKSFDGRGNYTLGLKEQIIFPEIDYDKVDKVRGMGISICTTAKNNDEARELLRLMGLPFSEA